MLWTEFERDYPQINPAPNVVGQNECPECRGRGAITRRNLQTLSPSDDFEETCKLCDGLGEISIEDDR